VSCHGETTSPTARQLAVPPGQAPGQIGRYRPHRKGFAEGRVGYELKDSAPLDPAILAGLRFATTIFPRDFVHANIPSHDREEAGLPNHAVKPTPTAPLMPPWRQSGGFFSHARRFSAQWLRQLDTTRREKVLAKMPRNCGDRAARLQPAIRFRS